MKALIYKPTKNVMQSGQKSRDFWVLEFEQEEKTRFVNQLIGWVGNSDMRPELNLKFDSKKAAEKYAQDNDINYEVIDPQAKRIIIRSYADNFK